jgi:hypothetical protein
MKYTLVPIACGTALALMAGAAGSHWLSVQNMATLAAILPRDLETPAKAKRLPSSMPDDGLAKEAKSFLAEARRDHDTSEKPAAKPVASKPSAPLGETESRMEKLLALLESTVEQNQELRDQIAGTNRDLQELRFQVDTYDGQFRPLKVDEEPNYYGQLRPINTEEDPAIYDDGSSGVLPPLDIP